MIKEGGDTHMINTVRSQLMLCTIVLLSVTSLGFAQEPEKTSSDYDMAGVQAQRAGRCEEALQQYAEAIKLDPKDFGAQFNSGMCYMIMRKAEQALPFLRSRHSQTK